MLQQQFDGVALEAAQIVMNERVTLLAAFQKLNCHDKLVALPIAVITALVRLEHSQLGAPAQFNGAPKRAAQMGVATLEDGSRPPRRAGARPARQRATAATGAANGAWKASSPPTNVHTS